MDIRGRIGEIGRAALYQIPSYDRAALYLQAGTIVVGMFVLWFWWPGVPTLAIAFLGVVAALMAIRADSLTIPEKIVWIVISFALFVIETRAVLKDRDEFATRQAELNSKAESARNEEQQAFTKVLKQEDQHFKGTFNEF